MKVCGFSFVRNGVKFDYPFVEAIQSVLPLCDKFIVAVGNSDDNTLEVVKNMNKEKIEILQTVWDESLRTGGRVFADETNKAFRAIPEEYDWAFYIQGDEVLHEKYIPVVREEMKRWLPHEEVEGLLFNYLHFFGSYDYVGLKHSWYRREIRIIRNRKDIFSYRDAQGFRKLPNNKLRVKLIDAWIYHYGYVREPQAMRDKRLSSAQLYGSTTPANEPEIFRYEAFKEPLKRFDGTHPAVMQERIRRKNWDFQPDLTIKYASLKDKFKRLVAKVTGWIPFEYRNYRLLR
ncbi:MAG: glycosyltransferase family 2 protein [Cyclobacteriaceae bacterium]|nr:glycosyltransferase family 2 protein [Cyclobacteriaceae bacterium]MDW8330893.1 glycosyltransferase family 2 protein [Cyclobacteriaceae bacterium]